MDNQRLDNCKLKVLLGFLIVGILFSCSKGNQSEKTDRVFRYNEAANITTLDPAFAKDLRTIWATNQLFNSLVQLNDQLEVEPDIAKSWEISNEGKNYEFTLRSDVFFHKHMLFGKDSTRRVTAKDFEYSFKRLLDPKVASPGKWVLEHVSQFEAVNDSIFRIELKQAFPPFISLLSMRYCSVVPKEQ